jgi:hypothetical protein
MNYLFVEYALYWLKERIKERTTLDGAVLIFLGIGMIVLKPLINAIALAAIIYGLWTMITEEKK